MKVKADRDEASPYAAMLAAQVSFETLCISSRSLHGPAHLYTQDVAEKIKTLGITALHIKLRATGRYIHCRNAADLCH